MRSKKIIPNFGYISKMRISNRHHEFYLTNPNVKYVESIKEKIEEECVIKEKIP